MSSASGSSRLSSSVESRVGRIVFARIALTQLSCHVRTRRREPSRIGLFASFRNCGLRRSRRQLPDKPASLCRKCNSSAGSSPCFGVFTIAQTRFGVGMNVAKPLGRLPFAVCRLPFAVCRLPFAVCRLPMMHEPPSFLRVLGYLLGMLMAYVFIRCEPDRNPLSRLQHDGRVVDAVFKGRTSTC